MQGKLSLSSFFVFAQQSFYSVISDGLDVLYAMPCAEYLSMECFSSAALSLISFFYSPLEKEANLCFFFSNINKLKYFDLINTFYSLAKLNFFAENYLLYA